MGWIYQVFFGQQDLIEESKLGIIRMFEQKIALLNKHNIRFVFVLDGLPLKGK